MSASTARSRGFRSKAMALVVAALLSACAGGGVGTTAARAGVARAEAESAMLPDGDWTVRMLSGERVRLAELRGRPVFLNFWATWCPPCVAEMGSIERLVEAMTGRDVHFVIVSPEEEETVRDFVGRHGLTLPVAVEETLAPAEFGELVLPTTVILDADGRIAFRHRGATEWDSPEVIEFLVAVGATGEGGG